MVPCPFCGGSGIEETDSWFDAPDPPIYCQYCRAVGVVNKNELLADLVKKYFPEGFHGYNSNTQ